MRQGITLGASVGVIGVVIDNIYLIIIRSFPLTFLFEDPSRILFSLIWHVVIFGALGAAYEQHRGGEYGGGPERSSVSPGGGDMTEFDE